MLVCPSFSSCVSTTFTLITLAITYKITTSTCTKYVHENTHQTCILCVADSDIQLSCGDSFLCVPTLRNAFHLFLVYVPSVECTYMYVLYIWWMCYCAREVRVSWAAYTSTCGSVGRASAQYAPHCGFKSRLRQLIGKISVFRRSSFALR